MTLEFTTGFFTTPDDPASFPGDDGAVRVTVGDEVLTDHLKTGFRNPDLPLYDAEGEPIEASNREFAGQHLDHFLGGFQEATVKFQRGNFDRFEELSVRVLASFDRSVFVLSFVDGRRARLAFQPFDDDSDPENYRDRSLLGYIVDPDDLCRELIGCYREWKRFVDNAYPDHEEFPEGHIPEFNAELDERISELEALVAEE